MLGLFCILCYYNFSETFDACLRIVEPVSGFALLFSGSYPGVIALCSQYTYLAAAL